MAKVIVSLLITLAFAFTAFAINVGPVQGAPEDETFGACDPILGNWLTDVVSWSQMPDATATFRRAASGAIGEWWYCFGDQNVATAHAFNMTTNTWVPPHHHCREPVTGRELWQTATCILLASIILVTVTPCSGLCLTAQEPVRGH